MVVLCPTDAITSDQLPEELQSAAKGSEFSAAGGFGGKTLKQSVEAFETQIIKEALEVCPSAAAAAERLGIDASTLSKKRKRYGI